MVGIFNSPDETCLMALIIVSRFLLFITWTVVREFASSTDAELLSQMIFSSSRCTIATAMLVTSLDPSV